ncbi:hypothetical protein C0995_011966 [Termitomyces sp. Mi166|nr:hypothetical protein C0995_011966 [Termitomyces sp. Mi166\
MNEAPSALEETLKSKEKEKKSLAVADKEEKEVEGEEFALSMESYWPSCCQSQQMVEDEELEREEVVSAGNKANITLAF